MEHGNLLRRVCNIPTSTVPKDITCVKCIPNVLSYVFKFEETGKMSFVNVRIIAILSNQLLLGSARREQVKNHRMRSHHQDNDEV